MATTNLRPFRDYDEKDVINIFAASGGTLPHTKGNLWKIAGSGLHFGADPVETMGAAGDFSVGGVLALRYGAVPKITLNTSGVSPVGMSLFDVREVDENGNLLKFNPRKAAEIEAVLSGQALPLVTRGTFAYSGVTGTFSAGDTLYVDNSVAGAINTVGAVAIGKALGAKDADGYFPLWLNIA